MLFTTLTFAIFLTIVFAAYWSLPRQSWRNTLIVVVSYVFYGWWDWRFCGLMLATSLLDYAIGLAMGATGRPRIRRALLVFSLLSNLGCLAFFKYFNFFAENFSLLANRFGWEPGWTTLNIVLPVGISFYTFQSLSYTIDVYRRDLRPTFHVVNFLAFVSFFPQLVAGPIERATHLLPQFFQQRRFDRQTAREGLRQMLWGAFKKMVIADNLALIVDPAFNDPSAHGGPLLAIAIVCFAFQIYCDFSGYSDIAIGCAKLFDFRLMRNFAHPYVSQSVAEFWRRWHISLATWFRDYLYIPLGGSRVNKPREVFNVLLTFLISGFWHGAAWNFLIWGLINGLAVLPAVVWRTERRRDPSDVPGGERAIPMPATLARMLLTFLVICCGWVFFRAATFNDALTIFARIGSGLFRSEGWREVGELLDAESSHIRALAHIGILVIVEWMTRRKDYPLDLPEIARPWRWAIYTIIIWDILYHGTGGARAFIYFQF
jgi:D-alanyl-lipoteichoic acid acyltransferase DltB (MBOAT superfamily)